MSCRHSPHVQHVLQREVAEDLVKNLVWQLGHLGGRLELLDEVDQVVYTIIGGQGAKIVQVVLFDAVKTKVVGVIDEVNEQTDCRYTNAW